MGRQQDHDMEEEPAPYTKPAKTKQINKIAKKIQKKKATVLSRKEVINCPVQQQDQQMVQNRKIQQFKEFQKIFSKGDKKVSKKQLKRSENKRKLGKQRMFEKYLEEQKRGRKKYNKMNLEQMKNNLEEIEQQAGEGGKKQQKRGKVSQKQVNREKLKDVNRIQQIYELPVFLDNPLDTIETHLKNTLG